MCKYNKKIYLITSGAIDEVLEVDDVNNDGYLEYVEFVMGRQRGRMAQEKHNKFKMGT